ncbi:RNA methyltransferase, partial [Alistipes sp. OttesenSCG-928-L06]|nr:RNA methyltransferase [Alistipes sp. OttesenSCG-928-L06]
MTKAEITLIKSLSDKKARAEHGLFVAEGAKLVGELIESGLTVKAVYALPETAAELPAFAGLTEASTKEMERVSHLKTPSKVLALVEIPRHTFDPRVLTQNLVLALDDIQDPGNLGTIIRLADWFGVTDIVCSPATADAFNPKVVQATMGAIARVRLHYGELSKVLENAVGQGVPVYGTFLEGERIYSAKLSTSGVIVMGNEGKGISLEVERRITRKLFIPPFPEGMPTSESLNVAIATAVVCAEFRR